MEDALFDLKQSSDSESDKASVSELQIEEETPRLQKSMTMPAQPAIVEPTLQKMASTVDKAVTPILAESQSSKESQSDEVEIEFVSPAMQSMEPIKLTVKKTLTLLEVKALVKEQHPDKPPTDALKIIYKGRQLTDEVVIGDAINIGLSQALQGGSQAKFHLLIDKRKLARLEENKTQEVAGRINAERRVLHQVVDPNEQDNAMGGQRRQSGPRSQRPLTKDEILVTKKYMRYERRLLQEYRKQTLGIETDIDGKFARKASRSNRSPLSQRHKVPSVPHPGYHQSPQVDTNMSPEQNFLLTRLPLMDHGFQERVGIYSASQKIKANLTELNENNIAIRLLGYDSILQPLLLMKLVGFMIIFGMQAPGRLKWVVIFLLITYYFYTVYSLYNDHFEQQRRLLNLQPNNRQAQQQVQNEQLRQFVQLLVDRIPQEQIVEAPQEGAARGNEEAAGDEQLNRLNQNARRLQRQQRRPGYIERVQQTMNFCARLIYLFFLSAHHDWIEPVLRDFDAQHAEQVRLQEAADQLLRIRDGFNQPPNQARNENAAAPEEPQQQLNEAQPETEEQKQAQANQVVPGEEVQVQLDAVAAQPDIQAEGLRQRSTGETSGDPKKPLDVDALFDIKNDDSESEGQAAKDKNEVEQF